MKNLPILILSLLLAPIASIAHTYLQVISEPGVSIYLEDEFEGTTNWTDSGLNLKVSPGTYDVQAKKEGFATQQTRVSLKKSDVVVWQLKPFKRLQRYVADTSSKNRGFQNQTGSLTVYSKPERCTITLVSSSQSKASWPKNQSRWRAQKIPAGKYTVKATARGKTLSYDVEIPAAGGVILYFDFRRGAASLRNVFQDAATPE